MWCHISVHRCTNYIFQNEKDETSRIGRKFSMTLVCVECSQLEPLLRAGEILSLSRPNKICRVSMENETCDIIEKQAHILKNHITDILVSLARNLQILNMNTRVIIAICFPAMQFST